MPRLKADLGARLPSTGQTALHLAAALGDLGVLRVLKVRQSLQTLFVHAQLRNRQERLMKSSVFDPNATVPENRILDSLSAA